MKSFVAVALLASVNNAETAAYRQHVAADPSIEWDSFSFSLNGVRTNSMWLNRVTVESNGQASYFSLTDDCLMALG